MLHQVLIESLIWSSHNLFDCIIQLLYTALIMMKFENISLHWVNRLGFLTRRELSDRFKAAGYNVSAEEWAVLLLLWRKDGLAPSELASNTVRDRTTVTRLLDGMEKKRLIVRIADEVDRRRSKVVLTEEGKQLEAKLVPIAKQLIELAHDGLSDDEQSQLVNLMKKMSHNLMR